MTTSSGSDDYRAWIFTLASALACVFGDTIVKTVIGRDVRILQNHKFLAGSLGLGSGVMAKEQLSSELSIFAGHADAYLMLFFFLGVGVMALIHWIMHRFESPTSTSPGIENTRAIQQFMQREAAAAAAASAASGKAQYSSSSSLLPQFSTRSSSATAVHGHSGTTGGLKAGAGGAAAASSSSTVTPHLHRNHKCEGCVHEEEEDEADECTGGIDDDEEERYSDSEYVDDEVTSLLNNAFLQIGKTPNSRMDDTPRHHMQRHHNRNGDRSYDGEDDDGDHDDDDQSIEIVITDQNDKILRRTTDLHHSTTGHSDLDLNLDLKADEDGHGSMNGGLHGREKSWSSLSSRSQKPFAPVNKKKKKTSVGGHGNQKHKGRKRAKECHLDHTTDRNNTAFNPPPPPPPSTSGGSGRRFFRLHKPQQQQQQPPTSYGSMSSTLPRSDQATHLRRTSFPRLKGHSSTVYSTHDNLDHAIADDREHADLTEIGIQTALTIAIHKFPGLSVFMAISVHNLIEGYLIAFPLYIGLHSRGKAFALAAALGGLSQPLGAILGWFILRKVESMGWQVSATGCIYALVAGMMSSIVVNGMWPQAVKCVGRNPTKVVQYCFFAGIAIMGICQTVMGSQCDF
ncbi:hypothetical protein BGX23_008047 [Mortierella sp. AD031]|nr:hypothetical protein BGX23_008047 [Mortierella sp. AD031]